MVELKANEIKARMEKAIDSLKKDLIAKLFLMKR